MAIASTGTILGANQRFHDLSDKMGVRVLVSLDTFLRPRSRDRLMSVIAAAAPRPESLELHCLDGLTRSCRVELIVTEQGERILLLAIDQLEEAAGAGRSIRARAALRHDLAGPLTAILGTAELLLIRGQDLPGEVRDSLGQILENCGRISEILAAGPGDRGQTTGAKG